ncbi:universal stress protein [Saccharopolyspora sp. ASAGF58]|uniref:universal stress protein n=1 Tax=Saccharopolyspora sp. ASAGF58 TaxID=2719023 RepID=UPI0035304024
MTADRAVVVGVDGSSHSISAATWAADEADLRHSPQLHLVVVTRDPLADDDAREATSAVADRVTAEHPRLEISTEVVPGHPADVLVRQSDAAQLVVVGSRGQSSLSAILIGSVSAKVAMHARCPVVVGAGPPRHRPGRGGAGQLSLQPRGLAFRVRRRSSLRDRARRNAGVARCRIRPERAHAQFRDG